MRMCHWHWSYLAKNEPSAELVKAAGSRIVAKLLLNRGVDSPEKVKAFLNPDQFEFTSPFVFKDMEKAVKRIRKSIEDKEHIVIYGDFDADGATSTSLLIKVLKYLGADASYYIPDRSEEGHGLNSGALVKLISGKKARLIITVDCGISNNTEITLAKGLGTDVIVTDHHEAPETLPPAYAIINPKSADSLDQDEYSDLRNLAGVGVAYKLACALLEDAGKTEYKDEIIHLVAIGTIADIVPLVGENRALVHRGLKIISQKRPAGVMKLFETTGYKIDQGITSDMIAFGLAPRINAVGRLAEAALSVELLTGENPEELEIVAKKLNYENKNRQQICEAIFAEADQKVKELDLEANRAIILSDPNWHPGIIGIVASKIVEKYYRPAFLISVDTENNEARCSARSVEGLHLYETLDMHADIFKHFGGHAFAAGFSAKIKILSFETVT